MVEKTETFSSSHDVSEQTSATEEGLVFDELTVLQPDGDEKPSGGSEAELHEEASVSGGDDLASMLASIHHGNKLSETDILKGLAVEGGVKQGDEKKSSSADQMEETEHPNVPSSDGLATNPVEYSSDIASLPADQSINGEAIGSVGHDASTGENLRTATIEPTKNTQPDLSQALQAEPMPKGFPDVQDTEVGTQNDTVEPLEDENEEAEGLIETPPDAASMNEAPDATNISLMGMEDQVVTITREQLLAASSDPENDALTVTSVDGSNLPGTLIDNGDGTWSFTPDADWNGELNLSYTVSDGYKEDTAEIGITLANDNTDVTNVTTDTETKSETVYGDEELIGSETVDEAVISQTTDSETGDVTTVYDTETTNTYETDYTTTDSSRMTTTTTYEDGTTTETSDWTVTGTTNGTNTRTETVDGTRTEVDPNEAPDATNISLVGMEDQVVTITATQLLAASSDPDNDALTVTSVDGSNLPGTLIDNGDGTWSFTPDADWNGELNLSYTVSDGYKEDTAQIDLAVEAVNDTPVAEEGVVLMSEDTPYTGSVSAEDVDGDTLIYTVGSGPEHGSLVLNEDGSYAYTPDDDFYGTDSFTYQVSDGQGGVDTAAVTLDVWDVTDNPNYDNLGGLGNDELIGESTGKGKKAVHESDTMYGGEGDDSLEGLGEDDELYGGSGNDAIDGGDGNDVIFGGDGDDLIEGWDESDEIYGDDGDDTIYGDRQHGGGPFAGNDLIDGGSGNDTIFGGDGDDQIRGSAGDDWLYGDTGEDLFLWDTRDGNDYVDGGSGWDLISLGKADGDIAAADGGWMITLDDGSEYHIDPSQDGDAYLDIADDSSGTIIDDTTGETITFEGIERIEF